MIFKKVKLKDIAKVNMGQSPKSKYYNVNGEGVPFMQGITSFGYKYPYLEKYTTQITKIADKDDILLSVRAPVGEINKNPFDKLCIGRGLSAIRMNNGNQEFLYYLLKNSFNLINKYSTGTVFTSINKSDIENLEIQIPNDNEQIIISRILSKFDDKIEINNKIIENLEAQGQAIFKNWFIDFEPFQDGEFIDSELGKIPKGWEVKNLGKVCDCNLGGTPKRKEERYWNGNIPWINSSEVNKDRIIEPTEYITELGLMNSSTKLLPKKTIVLAITGATLGQISILEINCCTNQSIVGVTTNKCLPYEYVYPFLLNNIERIKNMQTGGAQQHINLGNIKSSLIYIPPKEILEEYINLVKPMDKKISLLYFENEKLASIRDTLLPKLMSGEIRLIED